MGSGELQNSSSQPGYGYASWRGEMLIEQEINTSISRK